MKMIDKTKPVSIRRQCSLLAVSRASHYYLPQQKKETELANEIAEIYAAYPVYGYRRVHAVLRESRQINRKKVARMMKGMGLQAIYPGPKTTIRNSDHKVYPYVLKDIKVVRPHQSYQIDITYLRTDAGFVYLVALLDSYSRYIVSWRVTNSLETTGCLDALYDALAFYPHPELIHSDQGVQFTSQEWVAALEKHKIQVSMSGQGRSIDNAAIERLWRSLKYEYLFIRGCRSVEEIKSGVRQFVAWYNHERPHQSLGYKTPGVVKAEAEGLAPLPASLLRGNVTSMRSQNSLNLA